MGSKLSANGLLAYFSYTATSRFPGVFVVCAFILPVTSVLFGICISLEEKKVILIRVKLGSWKWVYRSDQTDQFNISNQAPTKTGKCLGIFHITTLDSS